MCIFSVWVSLVLETLLIREISFVFFADKLRFSEIWGAFSVFGIDLIF